MKIGELAHRAGLRASAITASAASAATPPALSTGSFSCASLAKWAPPSPKSNSSLALN